MGLAVVFGGNSFEHEISIVSAVTIKHRLKRDVSFIFCDQFRQFYLIPNSKMNSNTFSSGRYRDCKELLLSKDGFKLKSLFGTKTLSFEAVLNLIHGQDGEDGKIASLFDFYNIPYIGPRLESSVISYNKILTKDYAKKQGVDTIFYQVVNKNQENIDIEYPFIVKPARAGSSLGISIVENEDEIRYALDSAYEFDNELLIEPFQKAIKEYNLAGYKSGGKIVFSQVEEPVKDEFLDFESKYLNFSQVSSDKADITDELVKKLENNFEKIYGDIFDGAVIRCDFFVIEDKVYLNEINPVPGSLANYLFSDFENVLTEVSSSLPQNKMLEVDYSYIDKITKGSSKNPL